MFFFFLLFTTEYMEKENLNITHWVCSITSFFFFLVSIFFLIRFRSLFNLSFILSEFFNRNIPNTKYSSISSILLLFSTMFGPMSSTIFNLFESISDDQITRHCFLSTTFRKIDHLTKFLYEFLK